MGQAVHRIDKQHIEASIADWGGRIAGLYKTIESWLDGSEYKVIEGPPVTMNEEMMRQFGIGPQMLETRQIIKDGQFVLAIIPKALWVIGANGRLDMIGKGVNRMLVDYADRFDTPQWKLVQSSSRMEREDLTRETFLRLLV